LAQRKVKILTTEDANPGTSLSIGVAAKAQNKDIALPPVGDAVIADLQNQANSFLTNIMQIPVNSPAFEAYMKRIENLGHSEMSSIGGGSKRLIERNIATMGANRGPTNSHEVVGAALSRLDNLVKELAPTERNIAPRNLFGLKKRNSLNVYFDKYNEAQESINDVVKILLEGKDLILRDNAHLEEEKFKLVGVLNSLQEYLALVNILEEETEKQIAAERLHGSKSEQEIKTFETEVIFAIRQKKQDILSRITVGSQAYLAMGLIHDNNKQVRKSIDNARATTITALRTAIMVAQSLSNQKNLLDDFETIMRETEVSVRRASKDANKQAANMYGPKLDKDQAIAELSQVFDRVQRAIDTLSSVKESSDSQMEQSISDLNRELENSVEAIEENITNQQKYIEEDEK
jgi:uncharacterized protein YaaN involved in tellurite resistance